MARKEVYATTGTRMLVRVFAGWDFEPDEVQRPDFASQGYARGVPVGGDLEPAAGAKAARFMVRALRDPDGANLDRIQIVKGWLDADGEAQERIYDIAVSDGREIAADGRCTTPVGDTVDLEEASYTNEIGDAVMAAYWEDPDFDPTRSALYWRSQPKLAGLRQEGLRHRDTQGGGPQAAGAGLHLADLVHAETLIVDLERRATPVASLLSVMDPCRGGAGRGGKAIWPRCARRSS
jgi:hypothetical protein